MAASLAESTQASLQRELNAQRGRLGEMENRLAKKENALQQAQATLKKQDGALQRTGGWMVVCIGGFVGDGTGTSVGLHALLGDRVTDGRAFRAYQRRSTRGSCRRRRKKRPRRTLKSPSSLKR